MNPSEIRSVQFEDTFFPIVDGVVQTVDNYATIMNRISYCGVAAPRARDPYDDSRHPYDVFRCKAMKVLNWEYSLPLPGQDRKFKEAIIAKKPDIFHAHSPLFLGPYAA